MELNSGAAGTNGTAQGFRRRTLKLTWSEDSEFAGQVVHCRRPSIGALRQIRSLNQELSAEEGLIETFAILGGALISWNIEDPETGEAVPADALGLAQLDAEQFFAILNAWMEATTAVAPPLSRTSNSTATSPVEFDLMEALSQNQES